MADEFSERYGDLLTGSYDCVDRIVLNAYYPLGPNPGGFRVWWRRWHQDSDEELDNAHLMRLAGRFARRVRAWAGEHGVPVIYCKAGERKHRIAEEYLSEHTVGVGVFLILVARAPAIVWKVKRSSSGVICNLEKTRQYVNHYSFHIMDPAWGHLTIKMSGHPPFGAQVILNGHEYVACQAQTSGIRFAKEGNCFTRVDEPERLAQAPYSPGLGQGVCDLSQAFGFIHPREAVAFLREADAAGLGLAGDVLVAVEDDLRSERRMTAHLDRQVSPGRVHDVEGVVVDVLPGLLQVADHPRTRPVDLPHDGRCPGHQDQEHAHTNRVLTQILLGDPVLALPGLAVDHRHPVLPGPGPYPPGEPSRQADQVCVVQLFVAVLMPAPPPHPKPARVGSQRVVRVEHDPIHAVVATGQQIAIPFTEFISHLQNVRRTTRGDQNCPEGATASGRSPGSGVEVLARRSRDFGSSFVAWGVGGVHAASPVAVVRSSIALW